MTCIGLVAPSYPAPQEDVLATQEHFRSLGFEVMLPAGLIEPDLFCANQDQNRFKFLKQAIEDPKIDINWPVAGGYGMTRLMPYLQKMSRPTKEKLFIGFSDATAFHLFLNQQWGWQTIHGPSCRQIARKNIGPETIAATLKLIQEGVESLPTHKLTPLNPSANNMKSLSGKVVGGNLTLVTCGVGTFWNLQGQGKIIFLEEIDERGYRVDRMLTQLDHAGIFDGAQAILFGDFTGGLEADGSSFIPPVLERFALQTKTPTFRLPNVGHGKENFPLPLNREIEFKIG